MTDKPGSDDAQSLYDQLGGAPAIQAAVELFYRKVLGDDRIAHFFEDTDMERQMAKQAGFLTMVTGGPNQYTGKDMRDAHAHLLGRGLDDSHVDAVVQHLSDTLAELGVPAELVETVTTAADGLRDDVLGR